MQASGYAAATIEALPCDQACYATQGAVSRLNSSHYLPPCDYHEKRLTFAQSVCFRMSNSSLLLRGTTNPNCRPMTPTNQAGRSHSPSLTISRTTSSPASLRRTPPPLSSPNRHFPDSLVSECTAPSTSSGTGNRCNDRPSMLRHHPKPRNGNLFGIDTFVHGGLDQSGGFND